MKLASTLLACLLLPPVLWAADSPPVIHLWEKGAPGFESRKDEPEVAKDYYVKNINNPSLTVYLPPREKATGAAVVICPGGGHRLLVIKPEGDEPARFLAEQGIAAFVLKYRLGREENTPYTIEKSAKEDGMRAMRVVRSRAAEWGVDPKRIGLMGFSAGGEVVSLVVYQPTDGDPNAADPIEKVSARPDFQIMIYPGPIGIPDAIPAGAPPAFLAVANDDKGASGTIVSLLEKFRAAKIPVEAHVFARGGHGFNLGYRSRLATLKGWPQRLLDWMGDNNILDPAKPAPNAK